MAPCGGCADTLIHEGSRALKEECRLGQPGGVVARKSVAGTYVLWLLVGAVGGHRFYLGRIGSGLVMLSLAVVGFATSFMYVGYVFLFAVLAWWLMDAFRIPGMVRTANGPDLFVRAAAGASDAQRIAPQLLASPESAVESGGPLGEGAG